MNKADVIRGCPFSLDKGSGLIFLLEDRNWNDYGYYTLYSLQMLVPNSSLSFRIAYFRLIDKNQSTGSKPSNNPSSSTVVFVADIESAEKLLLVLTPEQRTNLQQLLSIQYTAGDLSTDSAFTDSVLRWKTIDRFKKEQQQIYQYIHSPLDISHMLVNSREQLCILLGEKNYPVRT